MYSLMCDGGGGGGGAAQQKSGSDGYSWNSERLLTETSVATRGRAGKLSPAILWQNLLRAVVAAGRGACGAHLHKL